jgi:hypothetical protein
MPRPIRPHRTATAGCVLAFAAFCASLADTARAQGFALYVSPPRFEIQAKPGETRRELVGLHHAGREPGRYRVYTADWQLRADDGIDFSEALSADSCRPWVAIERRELAIKPNGRYRFRFEVSPPADAAPRECRLALMIEGLDPAKFTGDRLNIPISGRIGVIVYVAIGDVAPNLAVRAGGVKKEATGFVPALEVTNTGNAHGRLGGFLTGTDANGRQIDLAPDESPILPGRTRTILLRPVAMDGAKPPEIRYPLTVKGTLEWGKSKQDIDLRFAP